MSNSPDGAARATLKQDPNFRWLMSGALISMLGDQFTLIALPWLVLKMSADTFVLGTVLALTSIPRALFILIGGALVDRHSPKRVMMLTKYVNTFLLGLLSFLIFTNQLSLWMVYGFALAIGLATAFSIPAGTSMMPHVVRRDQLQAANSMMMGVRQFSMFAGPVLAGVLIAVFGDGASGSLDDANGLAAAFLLDALSFGVTIWTLAKVNVHTSPVPAGTAPHVSVLKSVADGLRYCWNDASLRTCFLYWGVVALFITGPIHIAVPLLANELGHGAAAFGGMLGAHGAGTLIGMAFSGMKPNLRLRNFGTTILLVDAVIGLLFIPMGQVSTTWQGAALLLLVGTLGGFLQVMVYTWLQRHMAPAMMGRGMALFMFIFMGVAPISSAVTGWLMRAMTLGQLFAGSGALLVGIVAIAFAVSRMRSISDLQPTR